jgi:rhodanese-related sulfurtransferase
MTTLDLPTADVIDTAQLQHMIVHDPAIRILDVRSGAEFDAVHIPGSYNVPLDTLSEHVQDLADVEHPVVLVCKSGSRAGQARTKLSGAGKRHLHLLDGGLDAWVGAGGDVVRHATDTWALERQVRLAAGSIALVAILASIFVPRAKWAAGGVAFGLTFSALTDTCAMGNLLARLPYNRGRGCDVEAVLAELRAPR